MQEARIIKYHCTLRQPDYFEAILAECEIEAPEGTEKDILEVMAAPELLKTFQIFVKEIKQ